MSKKYPPIIKIADLAEILQEDRRSIMKRVHAGVYPSPIRRKSDGEVLRWKLAVWEKFLGVSVNDPDPRAESEELRVWVRDLVKTELNLAMEAIR